MRDLIITENITLDGVIDAADGWFMPAGAEAVDQSDVIAALAEQREAADAFLVGRRTFEQMRGLWPQRTDDETGVSDYLARVLVPALIAARLVDEYRLFVYPVVRGRGQ